MKKIVVLMMVCLLVGCNIERKFNGDSQVYASDEHIDLSEVVPSETTYDELLEMFGPADRYYYGERVLDVNDLPKAFYMRYDESLTFRIRNNSIIEMRIESESITYGDLYCGQSLDEALTYLNEPEEDKPPETHGNDMFFSNPAAIAAIILSIIEINLFR